MHTTKLLIAAGLLLSIAACKKEEATKVTVKDKLMGNVWKSTELKVNGVAQASWCWLNSLYEYTEGGTQYETQGDNLGACSASVIGKISSVPYKITADEKYLILVSGFASAADTFEIVSISSEILKTKRVVNSGSDIWEDTYTAQ